MKQLILFICFCLLLFSGCGTAKKTTSNTAENIQASEKQSETSTADLYSFVDTTKRTGIEINYYKIEFYPPCPEDEPNTIPDIPDLPEGIVENPAGGNAKEKPPNAENKQGAIKSIEGYTIKATNEQTGINEEISNTTTNKDAESNTDTTKAEVTTEQPAPDPYRWRYILGICIVVVLTGIGLYFGLRKTKVVKVIISFFKKIF